ncbi:hypothetical protein L873DRAFT_1802602 [Choiromyces venosus 120613-1]|uniref:Tafazzin family protein n=1 Tax=Choiromyces venosus 120613-1 TaxID=1336337 RepID=A0A3N4JUW2_9PEZI|nr:hypothetical protein L873DRAFT_1802602 [Choiromyces venosus 120613-1]
MNNGGGGVVNSGGAGGGSPNIQIGGGSLLRRIASTGVIAGTVLLSRLFLHTTQTVEYEGLDKFLELLRSRREVAGRKQGLVTVSNHISVLDDPLIFAPLPLPLLLHPPSIRYSLGSHDLCFRNALTSTYFTLGQVLPTYRLHKSPLGGPFQPAINASISLLSHPHHAWVHIFPEGRVHQKRNYQMRYFRWGVSRLLLEADVAPLVVPVFITGLDEVMHEARGWPRFLPSVGKKVKVCFGEPVDAARWEGLRREWKEVVKEAAGDMQVLKDGDKAVELRIRTAWEVRMAVSELRKRLGFPEEEEGAGLVETYKSPGMREKQGKLSDGAWEKDDA